MSSFSSDFLEKIRVLLSHPYAMIVFLWLIGMLLIFSLLPFIYQSARFLYKYFLVRQKDLQAWYGAGSWAIITGASSGQGKHYALGLAEAGFHLYLIGSKRSYDTAEEIKKKYPNVQVEVTCKDFRDSNEEGFFDEISEKLASLSDIGICINNIGHRKGWAPYHEMPPALVIR